MWSFPKSSLYYKNDKICLKNPIWFDCVRFWDTKEVNGVSINSKYWIKKDDLGIILGINNINA